MISHRKLERHLREPRHTPLTTLIAWLRPRIGPYRWLAVGILVTLAAQGFLEAYPVQLLRRAIGQITGPTQVGGLTGNLIFFVILWYGCAFIAAGCSLLASYFAARLGTGLGADLRQGLHDHIQKLSADFFEDRRSGDLLNRSAGDVAELQQYIVSPLTWIGDALFSFGFAFYFLLQINWQLTLMCAPVGVLLVGAMYIVARWIRPTFRRYREVSSDIFSLFSENVSGIREIQAFTREEARSDRYQGTNLELRRLEVRTKVLGELLTTSFSIIFPLVTVLVLWQGGVRVQSGQMPVSDLVAFLVYAGMLVRPLRGLGGNYAGLQRALVSTERIMEVLETKPKVVESPAAVDLPPGKGAIVFEGVSFSYDQRQKAVADINFEVAPGQMLALVGPSGAGKTTLIRLLLRYYDPQEGQIAVDGLDLREVTLRSLRGQMGVVFQDPFLFDGNLRENIAFGRPEATQDEILAAAQAADLTEFIDDLPDGYNTLVGERGVKLSGGQRSRLAIARAMLRNPRILILDEATAAVDTESERRIQQALDRLIIGRTCVVIAHRLSTVVRADQIIVLQQGKLVERGKHQDLLAQGGVYARLYEAQFAHQDQTN